MATWTPDPTFYPSPRLAAQAPPEKLAYVVHFDPERRRADGMAVVDVDSKSKSYAQIVGKVDLGVGDETHHFGWSACSSCLCPNAPHPHMERRYLVVPGIRSSRLHILDTKPDPRQPKKIRTIEADEIAERAGYSRPHTVHCGPEGHLRQRARQRRGQGPGRRVPDGPRDLRRARPLGDRPRAAAVRLRLLVAPRPRHHGDQRMGHARHVRERADPREDPGRPVRPAPALLGPAQAQARAGDRPRRQVPAGVRAAPGARPDQGVRLRQLRAVARGPVVVDLDLVPRRRQVGGQEGDHDPGGAGRGRKAAAGAAGLQGGGAARHRHRPLGRRQVPLRVVLGDRRLPPVRRERPAEAEAHRQDPDRRHGQPRRAIPRATAP